jgi:RNA ligase
MTKANHRVEIVRLGEPRVHPNADSLELFDVGEYQVVTKKGNFKAGDHGVYIQPDSVVPQTEPFKFIWETYVGLDGTVPEKRRRITVKRLRKEWSEGLLLPLSDFPEISTDTTNKVADIFVGEDDDISELLGITHYDPDAGKETAADNETFKKKRSKYPRSLKGWWYLLLHKLGIYTSGGQNNGFDNEDGVDMPVFDVDAFKHYKNAFEPGELVEVTEKIHGSNARFVFRDGHMYAGSRTQWKAENANCIWRNVLKTQPWIEAWCRAHEGYGLYGEVTPTQGENFQYGSAEPQLFVFDIRTPEGTWMNAEARSIVSEVFSFFDIKWVPVLYTGDDWDIVLKLVEGQTAVPGAKGIREGIVIRPMQERHVRGLGRLILKVVSNAYLEKDGK